MKSALAAWKFLIFGGGFDLAQVTRQQTATATLYFPLIGLFFGFVLIFLNRLLDPYLESEILGAILIAVLALLTRGIHYQGLQNTFNALSLKTSFVEAGRRSGALGVLAIVFVVLLKVRALEVSGETRSLGLLLTPMFARWSLVVFLYGSASVAEGTVRVLAENIKAWHLALTTIVTLTLAVFLVARTALWIGLGLSFFTLLTRTYLRRRNGYIHPDNLGAVIELNETLSFVLFASL
jgi:adenosylcobinamide-GDP ribazoletransferase